jgi:hypothetical protein
MTLKLMTMMAKRGNHLPVFLKLLDPANPPHEVSKDSKDAQDFPHSRKPNNTGKKELRVLGILTTGGLSFYISVGKFGTTSVKVQASQPIL